MGNLEKGGGEFIAKTAQFPYNSSGRAKDCILMTLNQIHGVCLVCSPPFAGKSIISDVGGGGT